MTALNKFIVWGPNVLGNWVLAGTGTTLGGYLQLSDADNSVGLCICSPKDGTIDKIGVQVLTVQGNPPAYYAGLVTVDTGTGNPDAGAYGGSAIESYDFTTTGWIWITLATPATTAAGDIFAVRIWPTGTAPDGSNYVRITNGVILGSAWPVGTQYQTSWNQMAGLPAIAAQYATTNDIIGLPAISTLYGAVNTGTTPDEVGNKFVLPATMKCIGARLALRSIADNATYQVVLYNSVDGVIASSASFDEDIMVASQDPIDIFWDEVTLTAGNTYRLTILPTNATSLYTASLDFESNGSKDKAIPDGANWQATSRTDAGAWTDDPSAVVWISPIISDITFATSGGGGAYGFAG